MPVTIHPTNNMKVFTSAITLFFAVSASANPFAPKVTKNTAKSNYVGRLLKGAKATANSQLRKLDEDEQEVDITGHSIKFEKCQFVKQYDEDAAENEDSGTVLATKRFVIFRLCPNGACSTCNYNYGEYIVDMESYLEATLEYKQGKQEDYCTACEECGQDDDEADEGGRRRRLEVNCNTCYNQCQNIENMEDNGYLDAAEYIECQKVYENENNGKVYYAGAVCASSGSRIKIGLFYDENCSVMYENADIESYLKNDDGYNMKLSYHLLKQVFPEDECVADCLYVDDYEDDDGNDDAEKETAEVCQQLYESAGKCEEAHGFDNGINYEYYNGDNWSYANQVAQEELICDFISLLQSGTYDQSGEIDVSGGRTTESDGTKTTGGQKFALTFFIIGTVGLAGYGVVLHNQLTKSAKADLSRQGGAMA